MIDYYKQVVEALTKKIELNIESTTDIVYPLCNLGNRYYIDSKYDLAFKTFEKALTDSKNPIWALYKIADTYWGSYWDWDESPLTKNQRIDKAVQYCKQLINFSVEQKQQQPKMLETRMYNLYAKLLYTWTNDCDTNKETQKIALTMYEKAIKMDQSLGWDIIKSM